MMETTYEDGRTTRELFFATDSEAIAKLAMRSSEPGVAGVTMQSLKPDGEMRVENGRCVRCQKKPYDCRCGYTPKGQ